MRIKTTLIYIGSVLLLAASITGCATRKTAKEPHMATSELSISELTSRIVEYNPTEKQIRCSMSATIKPNSLNLSSRIDMAIAQGEGIRLVATPFPLFEAGRMWLNKEGVTANISAARKRTEISWQELSSLIHIGLTYEVCEAIMEAKVFTSFAKGQTRLSLKNCKIQNHNGTTEISFNEYGLNILFGINKFGRPDYLIVKQLGQSESTYARIDYKDYRTSEVGLMPMLITGTFFDGNKSEPIFILDISKWRKGTLSHSDFSPKVKESYRVVSPQKLFEIIKNQ